MANAAVIVSIKLAELAGATLRASCITANVTTINVPPTHNDEKASAIAAMVFSPG
jgi:hypothetical protein